MVRIVRKTPVSWVLARSNQYAGIWGVMPSTKIIEEACCLLSRGMLFFLHFVLLVARRLPDCATQSRVEQLRCPTPASRPIASFVDSLWRQGPWGWPLTVMRTVAIVCAFNSRVLCLGFGLDFTADILHSASSTSSCVPIRISSPLMGGIIMSYHNKTHT